jgi:hypothetical protein
MKDKADIKDSGKAGLLTWKLTNDGTLIISGYGAMSDTTAWKSYRDFISSVILEDGVTSIGNRAFDYCINLTSVTIPNGVTSIEYAAFSECEKLTSIIIPDSVTSIGYAAFCCCASLTSITIPHNVTSIESSVFNGCTNLISIDVDEDNPAYTSENGILFNKSKTALIKYPEGKTETSYIIPDKVISIGYDAFNGCSNLTSITIPETVTSIEDDAFFGCTRLGQIAIPNNVTSIGSSAFGRCTNLTSVIIPDGITSIEYAAFSECENLSSITIPDSVTSIEKRAFKECKSLTSITIPDSVTSIGDRAFYGCKSLKSITIGKGITRIEDVTFFLCDNLISIEVDENNPVLASEDGVLFNKSKTELLLYPKGRDDVYIIPNTVTTINKDAFLNCCLASIKISYSVTSIEHAAFQFCKNLISIDVDENNPVFASEHGVLFDKSKTLLIKYPTGKAETNYIVPNSVMSIEESAFAWCKKLSSVIIPNSVTSIEDGTFTWCIRLISVFLPNTVTSIGIAAFEWCSNLISVMIPDSVTRIGDGAFRDCRSLTSMTIPDSVTTIGNRVFACCEDLISIEVGKDNPAYSSEDGVLFDKEKTILLLYPSGKKNTDYIIPDSVVSIENGAFSCCGNLASITIPDSVTSIEKGTFTSCCNSLTSVTIGRNVTKWFLKYCENLKHIYFRAMNPPTFYKENSFGEIKIDKDTCILHIPVGCKTEYANAEGWKEFKNIEEDCVNINLEEDNDIPF